MSAVTASVAPRASEPESPMITWAGWTLNHRKPSSPPTMSAHSTARFGWVGSLSRATNTNATKAKTSVPPARPSRPSVMLTPLAVATIANAAKAMNTHGSIITVPDERDRDAVDRVRALDLERRGDREDDEPDQLLARADPLARLGVEVVVERAEAADEEQRRQRRDDAARRQAALEEEEQAEHDPDQEQAAHRRRAGLHVVGLRPLLADPLAHADEVQEADVGRHRG